MAREIDLTGAYVAVIKYVEKDNSNVLQEFTFVAGPYSKVGTAKGVITARRNQWDRYSRNRRQVTDAYVLQATMWEKVE